MPFCRKCGLELKDDDVFCAKCGNKIEKITEETSESPVVPSMTKEESIELADKLKKEYGDLEKMQKEINENKTTLSKPIPPAKHHAAFKFFWPYLVASVITINALYILGYILTLASQAAGFLYTFSVIGLIAAVILLIVGGKTATSKRDSLNYQVENEMQYKRKRQKEIQEKTNSLQNLYSAKKTQLEKYNDLVPIHFRTARYMERVKAIIMTGKAENFTEAINYLPKENS
jgi:Skp family chaperone for outer membrane proteins